MSKKQNERIAFDKKLASANDKLWLIGVDEVGYGCFAGSLVVGAVALNPESLAEAQKRLLEEFPSFLKVKDSKKLTEKNREIIDKDLRSLAQREHWFYFAFGEATVEEINQFGMTKAHNIATERAIIELKNQSQLTSGYLVIIDGNKVDECLKTEDVISVVKADNKSFAVAAASILAKQYRDFQIKELALQYPQYDWLSNKGYGTLNHRAALKRFGLTPFHRLKYCKNHI